MFFKNKKKEEQPPVASPNTNRSPPTNPQPSSGIRIGSVSASASAEQLDQINANKQKIPSLFRLLAEHKLSERDIWEGEPQLFSILYQFKDQLGKTESPPNIITFHMPTIAEFGDTKKKSYKINKKFTVSQTIALICKKQQIPDPKRFWIGSLQGFIMSDNEPLSTYGLGSLFESWELRLIYKQDILSKSPLKNEPLESLGTEFIVVFELPPLEEFNGLKKHVVKVDSNQTIKSAIGNICKKYKVEGSERFSVMTIDENPLVEFVLFSGACFKHYGLGYKFKKWDLKIVFTDLIAPYVHRHTVIPMHGWAQVSPGQLDPFTARAIINDLEEKCSEFQSEIRRLTKDVEGGNELAQEQAAEIERLREEIARLQRVMQEEREATLAQNEDYEARITAANAEIETMAGQLRSMKARLDDTGAQLSTAKISNDDLTSTLHLCQADKSKLENYVEELNASIADYQQRLERQRVQSVDTENHLTQMIATLEREKLAIKEDARASLERFTTEKVSSEEAAKHLHASQAMLVTQLQDDLVTSQREREMMALQVQKATLERQEAVQLAERAEKKAEEMSKTAKHVERQFGDLERERDVLRQQVQIKLDEIADLNKDLEWSRETMADMERRLTSMSGEAKMYKDIKDKESARFKQSSQEETKTKNDLDAERKRNIDATAKFNKKIHELQTAQKHQEAAYQNAESAFKKRENELRSQAEDYRAKYEELRQQVQAGSVKDGASIPSLPATGSGSFIKSNGTPKELASSPVLIGGAGSSATTSPDSSSQPKVNGLLPSTATLIIGGRGKRNSPSQEELAAAKEHLKTIPAPAPTKEIAVVADNLYNSLQTRFVNVNMEAEELNLSESDTE
ncbi:hypothetical protein PPL_01970 [Heterostelium album PN500]|uniref:Uncharacterized protein n=1 Tax=Heterostelium pallidum (strain ATCC 26659 / Pp 5 / PN500) TaxID=670386 RepID=D3B102_HETP5|nr:hypothetical protein PPL_01970 [Heterostelium album PN500]EFA84976.1 hypothetical protein PPL_01970 [Heterostelium album PN500]|eukprot:XP_020437086.1 hypothetical protein PPL_01970 [Heterostelium album PN500]